MPCIFPLALACWIPPIQDAAATSPVVMSANDNHHRSSITAAYIQSKYPTDTPSHLLKNTNCTGAMSLAVTSTPSPPPCPQDPRTLQAPWAPWKWHTQDQMPTTRHRWCPTQITIVDRGREDPGKPPQPVLPISPMLTPPTSTHERHEDSGTKWWWQVDDNSSGLTTAAMGEQQWWQANNSGNGWTTAAMGEQQRRWVNNSSDGQTTAATG